MCQVTRAYDSSRRREQALETRERIAAAARALFLAHGWAGTRVRDVAREAQVSEPTVYAAYGNKTGLALALVDSLDGPADPSRARAELEAAGDDPVNQLRAMVAFDRRLFEGGADVIVLLREAGRSEPDLAAAYEEGRARGDRMRRATFSRWPADCFRNGVDPDSAADIFAALSNADVYRVLTSERGWPADCVETWWLDALARLVLAESARS